MNSLVLIFTNPGSLDDFLLPLQVDELGLPAREEDLESPLGYDTSISRFVALAAQHQIAVVPDEMLHDDFGKWLILSGLVHQADRVVMLVHDLTRNVEDIRIYVQEKLRRGKRDTIVKRGHHVAGDHYYGGVFGTLLDLRVENKLEALLKILDADPNVERQLEVLHSIYGDSRLSSNLEALFLLCQGYLAVYAETNGQNVSSIERIQPALRLMNWTSLDREDLPHDLKSDMGEVTKSRFWLDPFDIPESGHQADDRWKQFRQEVSVEMVRRGRGAEAKSISALLNQLQSDPSAVQPEIVANAYVELDSILTTS